MAISPCLECRNPISTLATACPHCGAPGDAFAYERDAIGTPLQTIQKTSKRLKGYIAGGALTTVLGIVAVVSEIMSGASTVIGFVITSLGVALVVGTKVRIWWHHG